MAEQEVTISEAATRLSLSYDTIRNRLRDARREREAVEGEATPGACTICRCTKSGHRDTPNIRQSDCTKGACICHSNQWRTNGMLGNGIRVLLEVPDGYVAPSRTPMGAAWLIQGLSEMNAEITNMRQALAEARQHNQAAWDALQLAQEAQQRLEGMVALPITPDGLRETTVA